MAWNIEKTEGGYWITQQISEDELFNMIAERLSFPEDSSNHEIRIENQEVFASAFLPGK